MKLQTIAIRAILLSQLALGIGVALLAQDKKLPAEPGLILTTSTPVSRAIQRGLYGDENFLHELSQTGRYIDINTKDADSIIGALLTLSPEEMAQRDILRGYSSPLYHFTHWLRNGAENDNSLGTLVREEGIPALLQAYDAVLKLDRSDTAEDLVFALSVLVKYSKEDLSSRIIDAAQRPLAPCSHYWRHILSELIDQRPEVPVVVQSFRESFPPWPIVNPLLSLANEKRNCNSKGERLFDCPEGYKTLASVLSNPKPIQPDQAEYTLAALKSVAQEQQRVLLDLAMQNPNKTMQFLSADFAARHGHPNGLRKLAEMCGQLAWSVKARATLTQLGHNELIPDLTSNKNFDTLSRVCYEIQKSPFATPPEMVTILEERRLTWSLDEELGNVMLVRYELPDFDSIGPPTVHFALVAPNEIRSNVQAPNPTRDNLFAFYAGEKATTNRHLGQLIPHGTRFGKPTPEPQDWLKHWTGSPLSDVITEYTLELGAQTNKQQATIALCSARLEGQEGWVVLDGADSHWYPESQYSSLEVKKYSSLILQLHLGRKLLGLPLDPKNLDTDFLKPSSSPSAATVVTKYEEILSDFTIATAERQYHLTQPNFTLAKHFDRYVEALMEVRKISKDEALVIAYEKLLDLLEHMNDNSRKNFLAYNSPIGEHFVAYGTAMIRLNRQQELRTLMESFEISWMKEMEKPKFGILYYLMDDTEKAESMLLLLNANPKLAIEYYRETEVLAAIYKRQGRSSDGQKLLIDSLTYLRRIMASPELGRHDRVQLRKSYENIYESFQKVFPESQDTLEHVGLTADPTFAN